MNKNIKFLKSYFVRTVSIFAIVLFVAFFLVLIVSYRVLETNVTQTVYSQAQKKQIENVRHINGIIETNSKLVKNLAIVLGNYDDIVKDNRRNFYEQTLQHVIEDNYDIYSVWTVFKPYSIDDIDEFYSRPLEGVTGQFLVDFNRDNEKIIDNEDDPIFYEKLDQYLPLFKSKQEVVILGPIEDPYLLLSESSYIIRIIAPVVSSHSAVGVVGIDINLNLIQEDMSKSGSEMFIMNEDFSIISSNTKEKYTGKHLSEVYTYVNDDINFVKTVSIHEYFSGKSSYPVIGKSAHYVASPMYFPISGQFWTVVSFVKENKIYSIVNKRISQLLLITVIIYLLCMGVIIFVAGENRKIFNKINSKITQLTQVNNITKIEDLRKIYELEQIDNSLQKLSDVLQRNLEISYSVIEDKEKIEIKEDEKIDKIKRNLLEINKKLLLEKKQKEEQEKQQEITNIVSKALSDINNIQREYIDDIEGLTYESIKYITNFTNSVQGGFYLYKESLETDGYLELSAFYSYNRRVYQNKRIEVGEGLAGACAQEKKVIYTKIPPNYLEITSGLGKYAPNYLFLLPLIVHERLYGIIELASLVKIEEYQNQFLDSISSVIASTISTSETNIQTRELLKQTQSITEEMKKNEELTNVQLKELEELKLENEVLALDRTAVLQTIEKLTYYVEFDTNSNVLSINDKFVEKIQIHSVDAMMMSYYDILFVSDTELHSAYWKDVLAGKTVEFSHNIHLGKFDFWFNCIMSPVYNSEGHIYKIIFFALDASEIKNREKDIEQMRKKIVIKEEELQAKEVEMSNFYSEHQNILDEYQVLQKVVDETKKERNSVESSMRFLQNEFTKRVNHAKRVELNLKKKLKRLEDEIKILKQKNDN